MWRKNKANFSHFSDKGMSIVEAETLVRVVVFGFWLDEIVMGSFLLFIILISTIFGYFCFKLVLLPMKIAPPRLETWQATILWYKLKSEWSSSTNSRSIHLLFTAFKPLQNYILVKIHCTKFAWNRRNSKSAKTWKISLSRWYNSVLFSVA